MAPEPLSRRLFSQRYDSVVQRSEINLFGPQRQPLYRAAAIGEMRLDSILSGQLVLTDAQALDGPLFLELWEDKRVSEAVGFVSAVNGKVPPIRIRCREVHSEPEVSLLASYLRFFTKRIDDLNLGPKAFDFSGLPRSENQKLARFLQSDWSARRLDDPETQIIEIFEAAQVERPVIDRQLRHIARLAESSAVAIEPWDATFDLKKGMDEYLSTPGAKTADQIRTMAPESAPAVEFVEEQLESAAPVFVDRSAVLRRFPGQPAARDLTGAALLAYEWFDRIYGFSLAKQHGCHDFAEDAPQQIAGLGPVAAASSIEGMVDRRNRSQVLNHLSEKFEISLESDFFLRLGIVNERELEIWAVRNAPEIHGWWSRRYLDRLDTVLKSLEALLRDKVEPALLLHTLTDQHLTEWRSSGDLTVITDIVLGAATNSIPFASIALPALPGLVRLIRGTDDNAVKISTQLAQPRVKDGRVQ